MRKDYKILLADDDEDDCMFFKTAVNELPFSISLSTVSNGVELMAYLKYNIHDLPHVIFLDLNMPLKTGVDCIQEIKEDETLKQLVVVMYSTSSNPDVMDLLYDKGAHYYIQKPAEFKDLKSVIHTVLTLCMPEGSLEQPSKEMFVLQPHINEREH